MRGHSVHRDTQTVGYLLVYQSFGHAADYILLAFAEQGELRVCGGTVRCFLLLEVASEEQDVRTKPTQAMAIAEIKSFFMCLWIK